MDKREQEFEAKMRRKLSEGSVKFDEAAWEKMERQLTAGSRKRRLLPVWWLRAAAAVLLGGVGIWAYTGYFMNAAGPAGESPSLTRNRPSATETQPPGNGNLLPGNGNLLPGTDDLLPAGDDGELPSDSGPAGISENEIITREEIKPGKETTHGEEVKPGSESIFSGETRRERKSFTNERLASALRRRTIAAISLEEPTSAPEAILPSVKGSLEERLAAAAPTGKANPFAAAVPAPETAKSAPGTAASSSEEKGFTFSMGLLAAPDLNGAGGFNGSKVGLNIGLGLGLHFNERLSLHSGIIYSRKPYNAAPAEYHTGYSPRDLKNIAAICDVIDIPLNLRYAVYRNGRNSISVNAGLSSYLMLREQYEYEYSGRDARLYEYKNENRHFMGVLNAGLAFERKVNDKMSIGFAPFIKVPLTGIGHGSVKLLSVGAALQLNLNMSKKPNIGN